MLPNSFGTKKDKLRYYIMSTCSIVHVEKESISKESRLYNQQIKSFYYIHKINFHEITLDKCITSTAPIFMMVHCYHTIYTPLTVTSSRSRTCPLQWQKGSGTPWAPLLPATNVCGWWQWEEGLGWDYLLLQVVYFWSWVSGTMR